MQVRVLLFGPQAASIGAREVLLEMAEPCTAPDVKSRLGADYATLRASLPASRVAVNGAFASAEQHINAKDEVALIGLVSGG